MFDARKTGMIGLQHSMLTRDKKNGGA